MGIAEDINRCFENRFSDGLPVVPPYAELVDEMLDALGWQASEVLAKDDELRLEYRAEHIAAAAVMAGCKVEYAKVLRPLSELLLARTFNLRGVATTTGGVAVLVMLAGPVVEELDLAHSSNALGVHHRPNATIGRFAQMVARCFGRAGGLLEEFGTMGHPGRYSFLVAEHPETRWPSFATQFGFKDGESCVGIMAAEGPNSVNNHYAETADALIETISLSLAHAGTTNYYYQGGGYLVILGPEHASLISATMSLSEARGRIFEQAVMGSAKLAQLGRLPRQLDPVREVDMEGVRRPVAREDQLLFIESGGEAGKFSAVIPGWVTNVTHVKSLDSGQVVCRKGWEF